MLSYAEVKPSCHIDFDSAIPYYYQLKQVLIEAMEGGSYLPGDRLPSEHELCEAFGVSRTVVRQALNELEVEGRLHRRKGRGSFVASRKVGERLFQNLSGLYEDVTARGGTLESEVRRLEKVAAPDWVAQELELEEGEPVIILDRLRFVNGIAWSVGSTYLPYDLCPRLLQEDMRTQSLYAVLEQKYSIQISHGRRSVEAVEAEPTVADALGIRREVPVLLLRSTSYGESGSPVEHFIAHHRGDLSRFEVTLMRHWSSDGSALVGGRPNMIADTGEV